MNGKVSLMRQAIKYTALLLVLLLVRVDTGFAASLKSEVKKQTVVDGETVLLYIIGEDLRGYPDTTSLNRRFDIVGSRRQESQFVDNGVVKSRFTMLLELLPKHLGASDIPAFEADGQRSEKITIEVVERGTPGVVPRDNVFAELSIDNAEPYVQAQAILSLHVFDDGTLAAAEPELPDIADMQIEQIPGDPQRLETRNGTEYRVHTWRYALFPQRSGSYDIPRIKVVGNVKDAGYGGNLILRNTPTRRINFRSDSMQIQVRPRPPQSTADWWLPVRQLDLQETWSSDPASSQVGEPLTFSVALTTDGATATQLPEIKLPQVDGLKIYPDVPALETQAGEDSVISRRTEKWSIIPQRPGNLTLPAFELRWWDTAADAERTATIPAQQFVVSGDAQTQPESTPVQPVAEFSAVAVPEAPQPAGTALLPGRQNLWAIVAVVMFAGWLFTVLAWLASARRRRRAAAKPAAVNTENVNAVAERQALRDLTALSESNQHERYLAGLLAWSTARWPERPPVSVLDVARRLQQSNNELSTQLQRLESSVYAQRKTSIDLKLVHRALTSAIDEYDNKNKQQSRVAANDPLPEL
jgi:hypothetical protein